MSHQKDPQQPQPNPFVELRDLLCKLFDINELTVLCRALRKDPEDIIGSGNGPKPMLAVQIISYFIRRDMLADLLIQAMRERPRSDSLRLLSEHYQIEKDAYTSTPFGRNETSGPSQTESDKDNEASNDSASASRPSAEIPNPTLTPKDLFTIFPSLKNNVMPGLQQSDFHISSPETFRVPQRREVGWLSLITLNNTTPALVAIYGRKAPIRELTCRVNDAGELVLDSWVQQAQSLIVTAEPLDIRWPNPTYHWSFRSVASSQVVELAVNVKLNIKSDVIVGCWDVCHYHDECPNMRFVIIAGKV